VSSVLSPVGPERPTVYWLRRVVVVVIVAAVVLLVAHACSGGSTKAPAADARPGAVNNTSPQPSNSASPPATPRCTPADLSVSLATDSSTYPLGRKPKFTATFRNISGATCRLVSTVASRKWTVTSGPVTTWSSAGCHLTGSAEKAMLASTRTATVSITWDAHRNDSSCTLGSAALPGTYVARGTFGSVTAQPAVFHVVS
jgi:hypothetical protein